MIEYLSGLRHHMLLEVSSSTMQSLTVEEEFVRGLTVV